ncbi:late secretory pathway protein avl9 [Orbilia brochopaga]|uniref:Late secretory pathway protein avl9 n=1 Tax=Orbilia brochopaga TaxID=3140254 RepID=A0AAV9URQ9_9PEZI
MTNADDGGNTSTDATTASTTVTDTTTATTTAAATTTTPKRSFPPIVSIVGFHHAKGPDVEHWFGGDEDLEDTCTDAEWPFFPFMALCDGSHSFEQDFSYFTLKREARGSRPASSLFGISCTMQLDSRLLKARSAEVTRSTVQKAVVVITDSPVYFGHLREQLVMVTSAWFAQRNFDDLEIIKKFRESLVRSLCDRDIGFDRETYLGMLSGEHARSLLTL